MPDDLPPEQRMFYFRSYYNLDSKEYYTIKDFVTGLWHGEKILAVLIDGLPSAGAGKGGKTVRPMRKLGRRR